MDKKLTVLMILDGFGISEDTDGNAIHAAKTPNIDKLLADYPYQLGFASGLEVGLPEGQMGNSEVGHLNIGAGRIVYQELTRISKAIDDGDFFTNKALVEAIDKCKANDTDLHLFGLLSDGGVHSHNTHLYALLELAKRCDFNRVYVHAFLDGRDTAPNSGKGFLAELEEKIAQIGVGKIATVSGRYYAMDRDKRWDRVEKAYDAMVKGAGVFASSAEECIDKSYENKVYDEFVMPTVILENGEPVAKIKTGDSVIFFNFRPDRAREISRTICDPNFDGFERVYFTTNFVTFTEYDPTIPNKSVAFEPQTLTNTLGEYLSGLGLKQLRLAETEKYAHVTFFFNGGVEDVNPGEERELVPSSKVATYDLKPEMSAYEVTDKLVEAIKSQKYDLIVINYANSDMVGHTGVFDAAVKAVEAVDDCVGRALSALLEVDGQMFLCADHGNSDKMVDKDSDQPFTAHSTNPVPFVLVNCKAAKGLEKNGKLCDIAPTLLDMMQIAQPAEMTGKSLLIK